MDERMLHQDERGVWGSQMPLYPASDPHMAHQLLNSMKSPYNNSLLSPQHLSSPPATSPHPHPNLLAANLPTANFMNAINFDQLPNTGLSNGNSVPKPAAPQEGEEAYHNQLQHLRQWQTQQQSWLLRQQEEQLALLHNEQQRVQRMIAQQRQTAWGQGNGLSATAPSPQEGITGSGGQAFKNSGTTLPQAIAQGGLAMARRNPPQNMQPSNENTPEKKKKGLPKPILPEANSTPSEYRLYGNPNLDSDTATMESMSMAGEEGVARLPDTPAEPMVRPSHLHSSLPLLDLDATGDEASDGINSENEAYSQDENEVLDFREQNDEEEEDEEEEEERPVEFDDVPVAGIRKKTFEELLEEELQKEAHKGNQVTQPAHCQRQFLKKGDGISRFTSAPKQPIKPLKMKEEPAQNTFKVPLPKKNHSIKEKTKKKTKQQPLTLKLLQRSQKPYSRPSPKKDKVTTAQPRDSVGEVSFQQSLDVLDKENKVDAQELQEFEILERYADDNASFMSSVSAVHRVLTTDKSNTNAGNLQRDLNHKTSHNVQHRELGSAAIQSNEIRSPAKRREEEDRRIEEESELSSEAEEEQQPPPRKAFEAFVVEKDCVKPVRKVCARDEGDEDGDSDDWDFGDNEAWEDEEEEEEGVKMPAITKTKVSPQELLAPDDVEAPPPTSKLVAKLFPKLKAEEPKKPSTPKEYEFKMAAVQQTAVDGVQSKALRDKLAELETEIERFRRENAALSQLRREREEGIVQLKKEMTEFEKQKDSELSRMKEFHSDEMKKLKKERRIFEQSQKAAKAGLTKKDREEVESLKSQLSSLQEEVKRKEQRWTASTSRLRDRVTALEAENAELKEEVREAERKRLEVWQQRDTTRKAPAPAPSHAPTPTLPQPMPQSKVFSPRVDEDICNGVSEVPVAHQPPPQPLTSPRKSTPTPPQVEPSPNTRPIPRKTAVAMNITHAVDKGDEQFEEVQHADGKLERVYTNGAREILFSNGTRKQVSADGQSIIVSFFNGDIKQILPDQRVIYYYSEAQTSHTTYPDGLEILQFPNNQTEKHYPDGTNEITFPDQTVKYLFPNGTEESIFADGTVIRVEATGDKVMEFPNGQREVHTQLYKRREYPDGTVKTVYPDGRQETRYSSGRVRVKDREGKVVLDSRA